MDDIELLPGPGVGPCIQHLAGVRVQVEHDLAADTPKTGAPLGMLQVLALADVDADNAKQLAVALALDTAEKAPLPKADGGLTLVQRTGEFLLQLQRVLGLVWVKPLFSHGGRGCQQQADQPCHVVVFHPILPL